VPQTPSRRRKWITNVIGLLVALLLAAMLISVIVRSAQRNNHSMGPTQDTHSHVIGTRTILASE
jgi:NADH:ubiquinone oxidoreductase subunit 6 (subunit J)